MRITLVIAAALALSGCIHTVQYNPADSGAHWRVSYEGAELGR